MSTVAGARQGKSLGIRPRARENLRPDNLAEQAYHSLRTLILERQIAPGAAVVEGRLAEELRISRTPMREALVRLVGEGLLERADARSYSVRKISPTEYFQSMHVRALVETHAMDLAIDRVAPALVDALMRDIRRLAKEREQEALHWQADDTLHLMFARASGNAVLVSVIETLRVNTRLFEIAGPFRRVATDGGEHLAILGAWREGDLQGAKKALVAHLRSLEQEALDVLSGRRV
ncbi:MAG: GntR family transcriptional regulator [Casimicrobiaceae bacterium]